MMACDSLVGTSVLGLDETSVLGLDGARLR
jgi:hypothetical protein